RRGHSSGRGHAKSNYAPAPRRRPRSGEIDIKCGKFQLSAVPNSIGGVPCAPGIRSLALERNLMVRIVVRDLTNDPADGPGGPLPGRRGAAFTPCPRVPVFELIESRLARFGAGLRKVVLKGGDAGISGLR